MSETPDTWWAPLETEVGSGWHWRLGPLDLAIFRVDGEWHLAWEERTGGDDEPRWSRQPSRSLPPELDNTERFAAGPDAGRIALLPRVADRLVVALPRTPLYLLPGERTKVYVSSPLWIDVRVGPPYRSLRDLPVKRLSDTWVGASTREGEVAYALKTHARVLLQEIPVRAYRCITPIVIANQGSDLLRVERMNLPIPYLSLYATEAGDLWTGGVELVRSEDAELARLDIERGAPKEAGAATLVSEARRRATPNVLVRAFSLLRSLGTEDHDG
jgi:hypothetical protein